MLGVINLGDQIVERPEQVAERIRAGLKHVSPDRLIPAPDCGMKYLVARSRVRKAEGARRRRRDRAEGAGLTVASLTLAEPGCHRIDCAQPLHRIAPQLVHASGNLQ